MPTFGLDGLSRQELQEGDEWYLPDEDAGKMNEPPKLMMASRATPLVEFEDFKEDIDDCGGYLQGLAKSVKCFLEELDSAYQQSVLEKKSMDKYIRKDVNVSKVAQCTSQHMLPDNENGKEMEEQYLEHQRMKGRIEQDKHLPLVKQWLKEPFAKNADITMEEYKKLVRSTRRFFVNKDGRLYRWDSEGKHKLVVEKDRRLHMTIWGIEGSMQ